jgi:hypothetical protein
VTDILQAFLSKDCAGCAGVKRPHQAFCKACYRHLPIALKTSLWKRFGEGFEEAYQACLSWFRLHPPLKTRKGQEVLFE